MKRRRKKRSDATATRSRTARRRRIENRVDESVRLWRERKIPNWPEKARRSSAAAYATNPANTRSWSDVNRIGRSSGWSYSAKTAADSAGLRAKKTAYDRKSREKPKCSAVLCPLKRSVDRTRERSEKSADDLIEYVLDRCECDVLDVFGQRFRELARFAVDEVLKKRTRLLAILLVEVGEGFSPVGLKFL